MGFCLILHGKTFGRLKFLLRLLFSHGQLLVDCLPWRIFKSGVYASWIGVACVCMGRP